MRRPSPALVVALLALFVALGGPAQAKKLLIGSKQIKDGAIAAKDLKPSLIKSLRATADKSIGTAKLADDGVTTAKIAAGNVTTADLADGAVSTTKIADGAVTGKAISNGTLDAKDIGGFAGTAKVVLAPEGTGCTAGTTDNLTPLVKGQDLSNDAIVVTPTDAFPGATTVTARPASNDRIRITACGAPPTGEVSFRYVTFDVA